MKEIQAFEENWKEYDKWFEENKHIYNSELSAIKELLPDFKNAIEIGVGTGNFAKPLGIKYGIEPSKNMGEIAARKGIKVMTAFAENIPLDNESYDLVLLVTTLCFLKNPRKAFCEIYRILKPEGFFVNAFIDKNSTLGKIYQKNKENSLFYKFATFYSVEDVLDIMKQAGFGKFDFRQTIFDYFKDKDVEHKVKRGFGEGSFVVIRAQK